MSMLKKYSISLALSCLVSVSVLATETKPAQVAFDAAVAVYNKGDFTAAYKQFNELYELKSDEPVVNFYLGRCATELKLYDQALLAYERVLVADPAHARSRVEMARIYMEEGSFDNAEVELKNALEYKLPDGVKSQVNDLLKAIENSRKKHHLSGALIGGFGVDTNVKNASPYLPSGSIGSSNTKPAYDYSINETVVASHVYDVNKNLKWQNNLVIYGQQYREVVDANVFYMQLGSGLSYTASTYQISLIPTVEALKYGLTHDVSNHQGVGAVSSFFGKLTAMDRMQDTMDGIGVNEKFSTSISSAIGLEQSLGIKKQFFTTVGMDAIVLDASMGLKKILGDGRSTGVSLVLSKNIATDNSTSRNTATNYYSKAIRLDYGMPVAGYFDFGVNVIAKQQDYQDNGRSDLQKSLGLTASRPFGKDMLLGASFNRIWNGSSCRTTDDSQQPYQKTTFGVSLTKAF